MKSFLSKLITLAIIVLGFIVLEGACFRLVESYAKLRLVFAWGKPGTGAFNSYLKKLPLDHFAVPPNKTDGTLKRILAEHQYAGSVMSFGRPIRDKLREEFQTETDPLSDFAIKNIGELRNVFLPGLTKPARTEHVNLKLARRIDDPMEFAKGLLIRIVNTEEKHLINAESNRLENVFKLILERGIACVVLPVFSSEDLLFKTKKVSRRNPTIAKNIFLWGDKVSGDLILEATQKNPELYKAILVNSPESEIGPPQVKGMPWLLWGISEKFLNYEKRLKKILDWIDRGRDADRLYPSRLGGLTRVFPEGKSEDFESFALAWLFTLQDYVDQLGDDWPSPKPLWNSIQNDSSSKDTNQANVEKKKMTFLEVEEELQKIKVAEELEPHSAATFDCEIIRGYRLLHSNDMNLRKVSNRDLVLKLGMGFEKMGEEVLEKIGQKDPLFLRYYNSLKEVQDSPLN